MVDSGIVIREAVIADSEALAALSGQLGYPASADDIRKRLSKIIEHDENCAFTAVMNGRVIGWIHAFLTFRLESPAFVEIAGLVVDENRKGAGAGRELVNAVIGWASNVNVASVRVRSNAKRQNAHDFYRHIGFDDIKDQKVFSREL